MTRHKGYRALTRYLCRKPPRQRGIRPLTSLLIKYSVGDIVDIKIDPSEHNGMPYRRFHGKTGRIVEIRGNAFVVEVKDGNKMKKICVTRSHFQPNFYLKKEKEELGQE
nr:50S ribosomal protein L21e [Candidatus Sigynarchaeota archaeon]